MNRVHISTDATASESEGLTDEQEAIFNQAFRLIEMFRWGEISFRMRPLPLNRFIRSSKFDVLH